jgi:hypothetical protein
MLQSIALLSELRLLRLYSKTTTPIVKLENPLIQGYFQPGNTIDRQWCHRFMMGEQRDANPEISLICAHFFDASRHIPATIQHVSKSDCLWETICTFVSIDPMLDIYIQNISYFSPLAEVKSPILHFLTKCIPVRCQTRTEFTMLRKLLVRAWCRKRRKKDKHKHKHSELQYDLQYDDSVFRLLKRMVLCVLLGNYAHCDPATRPTADVRLRLYEIFTNRRYERWIIRLFYHCEKLVTFAARTCIITSIEHNPSLSRVVSDMLKLPLFKQIVEEVVGRIRLYFQSNLCTPNTALYHSFDHLPDRPAQPQHYWVCNISRCRTTPCPHVDKMTGTIRQSHKVLKKDKKRLRLTKDEELRRADALAMAEDEVLKSKRRGRLAQEEIDVDKMADIESGWSWKYNSSPVYEEMKGLVAGVETQISNEVSFERPRADFALLIAPLRSSAPLIRYREEEEDAEEVVVKMETEEEEEEEEEEGDATETKEEATQRKKEEKEERMDNEDLSTYGVTFARGAPNPYLPQWQMDALCDIVEHSGPVGHRHHAIHRVVPFFVCFGVLPIVVQHIQSLFAHYCEDTMRAQTIIKQLKQLRIHQPQAYNLLHISIQLIKKCEKRFRLWGLPHYITEAQIDTLSNESGQIFDNDVAFVFCDICGHIYSNIRDANSAYTNTYSHGMREPSVDFLTGKIYCGRKRKTYAGRCGEQELARIPMIGEVLYFRLKTLMICPQLNCHMLMAFDSKQKTPIVWNERGPACQACSVKLGKPMLAYQQLRETYQSKDADIECVLCYGEEMKDRLIKTPYKRARIYPGGMHLCPTHHSDDLVNEINHFYTFNQNETTEERTRNTQAILRIMHTHRDTQVESHTQQAKAIQRIIDAQNRRLQVR